jgi:membrane-bound serine protease (ClpP class)
MAGSLKALGWATLALALVLPTAGAAQAAATAPAGDTAVAAAAGADAGTVYRIPIEGVIEHGLAAFVERSLRDAHAAGATAVVLDIETPGGRVDAAQRIVRAVRDSPVPVYAFVDAHAWSAGALIALATQRIYMQPGSSIGAATPVTGEGVTASEKMVSAMRSEFRALAEARGIDPRIAEAMVDEAIEVEGVVAAGQLLTLTVSEAAGLGLAVPVADREAVLAQIGAPDAVVVRTELNWAERVVRFLTSPLVAPFLLSLGFLGLVIEVKSPGLGVPGMVGATSLGLFFGSHLILGLAGWEVLILLALGIGLLAVEILLIPGFGVAGALGLVSVLAAVFLSMIGNLPTWTDLVIATNVIAISLVIVVLAGWAFFRRFPAQGKKRNIMLGAATSRELGYLSAPERPELMGAEGVALTDLRPAGTVRIGEENVDVVSEAGWVPQGTPVRVIRTEGYRHVVRPLA